MKKDKGQRYEITPDCVAQYLSLRREKYKKEYANNESISNHFQAELIYRVAMVMKKGFDRNNKHYYPNDIVFVKMISKNIFDDIMNSGYYWYFQNGEILSIKDEDIFDNEI